MGRVYVKLCLPLKHKQLILTGQFAYQERLLTL